jgi:hypothetical protein
MIGALFADRITLVKKDGTVAKENIAANVDRARIITQDAQLIIEPGDHFLRKLPNGMEEDFIVEDPHYRKGGSLSHWEITVRRSNMPPSTRQTIVNNISGNTFSGGNIKLSQGLTDLSTTYMTTNISENDAKLFTDLANAITQGVSEDKGRADLLKAVQDMREAKQNGTFLASYQKFMTSIADHVTIVSPFLPALAQLL